ncbi:hypothetical protein D3C86_1679130 [compost metagenome]
MRDEPWILRHANVPHVESGRFCAGRLDLAGNHHDIAHNIQRVGADLHVWELRLADQPRFARIGDIDRGEILRRRFMRHPQNASAIARLLHRNAFAKPTESIEFVLGQQAHIERQRGVCSAGRRRIE